MANLRSERVLAGNASERKVFRFGDRFFVPRYRQPWSTISATARGAEASGRAE
jgi:hypothetical protein